eukprot:CAMPEP_0115439978 /NCGR_PEP_ID=MMETSP0271-20121206/36055_1 /TAXON_ID=71861 /ORGANISM="Scrippsiella trochoidea, Strain CCMP3099" /LENGTH=322 /DNA_ID=CAMNT_0002865687 /DNA_START=563 /DNA_END=1528 /DNA_ORIENTATION=-
MSQTDAYENSMLRLASLRHASPRKCNLPIAASQLEAHSPVAAHADRSPPLSPVLVEESPRRFSQLHACEPRLLHPTSSESLSPLWRRSPVATSGTEQQSLVSELHQRSFMRSPVLGEETPHTPSQRHAGSAVLSSTSLGFSSPLPQHTHVAVPRLEPTPVPAQHQRSLSPNAFGECIQCTPSSPVSLRSPSAKFGAERRSFEVARQQSTPCLNSVHADESPSRRSQLVARNYCSPGMLTPNVLMPQPPRQSEPKLGSGAPPPAVRPPALAVATSTPSAETFGRFEAAWANRSRQPEEESPVHGALSRFGPLHQLLMGADASD